MIFICMKFITLNGTTYVAHYSLAHDNLLQLTTQICVYGTSIQWKLMFPSIFLSVPLESAPAFAREDDEQEQDEEALSGQDSDSDLSGMEGTYNISGLPEDDDEEEDGEEEERTDVVLEGDLVNEVRLEGRAHF